MKALAALGLSLGLVSFAASSAHAAGDAQGFGEKNQLMVSADRLMPLFGYTRGSVTTTSGGQDITNAHSGFGVSLLYGTSYALTSQNVVDFHSLPRVAFDYTVIDHLTLGGAFALGFGFGGKNSEESVRNGVKTTAKTDDPSLWAIGFAPRVGYVLPLGDLLAFWPRLGLGVYHASVKSTQTVANVETEVSASDTLFSLDLDPQITLVPYRHFFVNAGPILNIPLTGTRSASTTAGSQTTSVSNDISVFHLGLSASLGGWFDL